MTAYGGEGPRGAGRPRPAGSVSTLEPTLSRPQRTPSRRTLVLIVVPILAVVVVGTVGNAIHPSLVNSHPLVLVAMEPRNRFLLLVAEKVSFWPFLLVATIRRLVSDPLFYLLGYLYGERGVRWMERKMGEGGGLVRGIERGFSKAAPVMVFLFPGAIVCVLAGATGMSPVWFLALNVAGTVTVVSLVYRFADVLHGPISAINRFYGNNTKLITAVSVALTLYWLWDQRRKGRSELQSISSIEKELNPDEPPTPGASEGEEGEGRTGSEAGPEHQ